MKKGLSLILILETLIVAAVFVYSFSTPIDGDLGWHLKYGQYFWETGKVLTHDIFSSSLPGFYWVNGSGWGYGVIVYPFFKLFGFIGMTIWGAATITLAFIFITAGYKVKPWLKMLLLLPYILLGNAVVFNGMRAQLNTVLGIAIVYFLISRKKFIYLPFVFLIWVNLHGGFILGLFVWFVFLATKIVLEFQNIKKRKVLLNEVKIFIVSILVCLINPFTYQIFTEAYKNASSPLMHTYILEWMPIDPGSTFQILFFIYSVFLLMLSILLIKDWKKILPHFTILTIFFFLTLGARRYLSIYILCSFPFILIFFEKFQNILALKYHKIMNVLGLVILIPIICYALFISIPSIKLNTFDWNAYCLDVGCSENLSNYLNQNPPKGRGFNVYQMGGYLIWKVPKIKTFIDGRMTVWEENEINPFRDYIDIYLKDHNWKPSFEKQNFSWAIVIPGSNLDKYLYSKSDNWKLEYFDNNVDYYTKI